MVHPLRAEATAVKNNAITSTIPVESGIVSLVHPKLFSATPTNHQTIILAWQEVAGATGYNIYRSTKDTMKDLRRIGNHPTAAANATTLIDLHTPLALSSYYYSITTLHKYGESPESPLINIDTPYTESSPNNPMSLPTAFSTITITPTTVSSYGASVTPAPIVSTPIFSTSNPIITPSSISPSTSGTPTFLPPPSASPTTPITPLVTPSLPPITTSTDPLLTHIPPPTPTHPTPPSLPLPITPLPTLAEMKEPPKSFDHLMQNFEAFMVHTNAPSNPTLSPPLTNMPSMPPPPHAPATPALPPTPTHASALPDPALAKTLTAHFTNAFMEAMQRTPTNAEHPIPMPTTPLYVLPPPLPTHVPEPTMFQKIFAPTTPASLPNPALLRAHEMGILPFYKLADVATVAATWDIPATTIEQKVPEAAVMLHTAFATHIINTPPLPILLVPMSITLAAVSTSNTTLKSPEAQYAFVNDIMAMVGAIVLEKATKSVTHAEVITKTMASLAVGVSVDRKHLDKQFPQLGKALLSQEQLVLKEGIFQKMFNRLPKSNEDWNLVHMLAQKARIPEVDPKKEAMVKKNYEKAMGINIAKLAASPRLADQQKAKNALLAVRTLAASKVTPTKRSFLRSLLRR